MVLFVAELDHLNIWATDIGNAYLKADTSDKAYVIAGPEFKDCEGHTHIISKAVLD
jgi:hypothetical protein